MPVYEYEPVDRDCLMCDGRFGVIQSVSEDALNVCPYCGMDVRRVISKASIKVAKDASPDKAGSKGFTTYRRVEEGKWERISGEGVDRVVGSEEDIAAVKQEQKPTKVWNVDEST
jgi:putative FmdB family regulatory protein